jgi:hypothetical protein
MTEAETSATRAPHPARPLVILAADHRSSLERDLYGLTAPPTPAQAARISADKMLIYQALLDAVPQLPVSAQPGILIDEQYGASVAELATRAPGAVSLAMPVEASGEQWFHFASDGWQAHAALFATDHAKVLMRGNPGLEPGQRAAQAERLAKVSDWAAANGRALIVELLVPASAADLAAAGGPPTASSSDATQARTSLTTGCRSRPQFRVLLASPSAAASGRTRCMPICVTAALPRGPGAGSPPPTATSCVTSSTPARERSRCTTSPIPSHSVALASPSPRKVTASRSALTTSLMRSNCRRFAATAGGPASGVLRRL